MDTFAGAAGDNVKVVLKMYEHFGNGRLDLIADELMDPDIVWRVPGHHPLAGEHRGPSEVMAFLGAIVASGVVFADSHFGELDDGTVAERHQGRATLDGVGIELPTVTLYEIFAGRITAVQVHPANQHDLDRYMWVVAILRSVGERLADPTNRIRQENL